MGVGFWAKVVDLARRIWGGVKKGAKIATRYVLPVAKQATSLLSKSDNKTAARVGGDLYQGLGKISPLIAKLAERK